MALTRDPALVAGLGVAQQLPLLLLGLPAGVLADRLDRRRLLILTNIVEAVLFVAVGAAVVSGTVTVPALYVAALALGSNETARDTTMATALPALVAPRQLTQANSRLVSIVFVGQQLAGPAAGAGLFAVAMVLPFGLAAVLVGVAGVLVATLPALNRTRSVDRAPGQPDGSRQRQQRRVAVVYRDIAEGIGFLARHRLLRTIALLAVVLSVTDAAWFAILVLFVTDELGLPGWTYGVILAVAALGGAGGGWTAPRIVTYVGPAATLRGGLVVIAIAQAAIGLTHHVIMATIGIAIGNGAIAVWFAEAETQRQALTPDHVLGRVTAAWRTAIFGVLPLGALTGGLLANALGLRAPFLAGVPLLLAATLLARPLTAPTVAAAHADRQPNTPSADP